MTVLALLLMAVAPGATAVGDCSTKQEGGPGYSSETMQCTVRTDSNGVCIGYYYNNFTNDQGSFEKESCDRYIET